MSDTTDRARNAAEKYCHEHPFTVAGLTPVEVEFIQRAYRKAHLAGQEAARAKWDEERRLLMVANASLNACVSILSREQKEWAEERELLLTIKELHACNANRGKSESIAAHDEWLATQSSDDQAGQWGDG